MTNPQQPQQNKNDEPKNMPPSASPTTVTERVDIDAHLTGRTRDRPEQPKYQTLDDLKCEDGVSAELKIGDNVKVSGVVRAIDHQTDVEAGGKASNPLYSLVSVEVRTSNGIHNVSVRSDELVSADQHKHQTKREHESQHDKHDKHDHKHADHTLKTDTKPEHK